MSRASAQSPRSSTPSLPSPLPYTNKDEAKRWLEHVLTLQGLPQALSERASTLQKRINVKGQPWDELKPDLEALYNECVAAEQQRQQILQQIFQVQFPTSVLRDARVDDLVRKVYELDITKQVKDEVTADMENTRKRLATNIEDNFAKIQQLKSDLADRDKTIMDLKEKLKKLTREKKELESKIKTLEKEIDELKQEVGQLQLQVEERDKKIKTLIEMHDKRLESMNQRIDELEAKNRELAKMSESKIVVGETMKIMVKAIYMYVHSTLQHRKRNSYSVYEISDHLTKKYTLGSAEEKAAEERWEKLKGTTAFWGFLSVLTEGFVCNHIVDKTSSEHRFNFTYTGRFSCGFCFHSSFLCSLQVIWDGTKTLKKLSVS